MIPREIHDPKVLRAIAEEAKFTGIRCYNGYSGDAYRNLAVAAMNLAWQIENGFPTRATCEFCKKNLRLKKNGTFRYHNGCKGDGHTPQQTRMLSANDEVSNPRREKP